MIVTMKRIITMCALLFLFTVQAVSAAYITTPKDTFDIPTLKNIAGETIYGKLTGFPHTFTFAVSEETPFSMQVSVDGAQEVKDVSLILIKQEKRGVSEIGRMTGKDAQWVTQYDVWRAVTFANAPVKEFTLAPGTYRLEVSAPENNRGYRLVLGEGDASAIKELFMVRKVFDVGVLSMMLSPFFLGVFVLLGVGLFYYKRKKYAS